MAANYIITIHNKEWLIERVLNGVERNASSGSVIVPVLDGCSDRSEEIVRAFAAKSRFEYRIVLTPDVHEIRSINAGLRVTEPGFCYVLQDDVILDAVDLEAVTNKLWEQENQKLGYLSFRMGCQIRKGTLRGRLRTALKTRGAYCGPFIEDFNHAVGDGDHFGRGDRILLPYQVCQVDAGVKSPVCFTPALREICPQLDENLAPYCYDDVDMSLEALRAGLRNFVLPFPVESEIEWGGTRKSAQFQNNAGAIMIRNRQYLYQKHRWFFRRS